MHLRKYSTMHNSRTYISKVESAGNPDLEALDETCEARRLGDVWVHTTKQDGRVECLRHEVPCHLIQTCELSQLL